MVQDKPKPKKPFVLPEQLTDRPLRDNPQLAALRKKLSKE